MFSYLRRHFGTAGLVVAIVALVAALAGGAYAASGGLTGKQKKEVKSIAKSFQGKGPKGDAGAAGAAGLKGDPGLAGGPGKDGKDGVSVTSAAATAGECPTGGVKLTSASGASKVCNGEKGTTGDIGATGAAGATGPEGSPWTAAGNLPELATETGSWGGIHEGAGFLLTPVSFTLPVVPAPELVFVGTDGTKPGCPGVTAGVPTASEGKLCVYAAEFAGTVFEKNFDPTGAPEAVGTATIGTMLGFECAGTCIAYGSWAVTALEVP
jgi:hypothetical protein